MSVVWQGRNPESAHLKQVIRFLTVPLKAYGKGFEDHQSTDLRLMKKFRKLIG